MAFVDQSMQTNRKAAIAGVAVIHLLIGTILVAGLSTTIVQILDPPSPDTFDVPSPTPPPPDPVDDVKDPPTTFIHVPPTPFPVSGTDPLSDSTTDLPELSDVVIVEAFPAGRTIIEPPALPPAPTFEPIPAKPSNNPGDWVTTNDYRSNWINREWTGTARFKVSVGTNGKVQNCQILATTGHAALDEATCKLVKQRARFEAARDSEGRKIVGEYGTAVKWQLPR